MKQGSNKQRPRRGGAPKGNRGPVRNQTFDSNGPGIRVRGNAQQVMEKYLALARDAVSSGDRILAENYYQHAEHYFRIANVNGALTQRVLQGGMHAQQTPAHDHSVLDDLFEYEEEAALQQVNGGHNGHGDYGQQQMRGNGAGHDDSDEDGDDQPQQHYGQSEGDRERGDDQQGERQGRSRRQRGRRGGRDRGERHEAGGDAPQQAQPQQHAQPEPQPQPQPEPRAEAVEKAPKAEKADKPAKAEQPVEAAAEKAPDAPKRSRAKAAQPAPEEAQPAEGDDAAPRRRRRAPARKAADKGEGEGDAPSSEPREAVA